VNELKPEPEFVDYLIEVCDGEEGDESDLKSFLGVKQKLDNNPILPHGHTYLYCLSSLPGFHCFWVDDGGGYRLDKAFWIVGLVSSKIDEGKKVYARFRI